MSEKNLLGKTALVTGGSRGIGAACARRLAAAGADVAITYQRSEAKAAALVEELTAMGATAAAFQADQADRDQVLRMVGEVVERFGHVDVLVNNAAVFLPGAFGALSAQDVAYQWSVNVQGVADTTYAAVAHMPTGGRVINISSIAGVRASVPGFADYSATKAAIGGYSRAWALDLAPRDITVNSVVVSFAQTDMVIPADTETGQMIQAMLPLHRYASPEEIAATVGFLAGPEASYVTGSALSVDGGWNA